MLPARECDPFAKGSILRGCCSRSQSTAAMASKLRFMPAMEAIFGPWPDEENGMISDDGVLGVARKVKWHCNSW